MAATDLLNLRERAECLVPRDRVQFAIDQLAVRMAVALARRDPLILCVLKGGLPFTGELLRRWDFPLELDYLHVSRYGQDTRGGALTWHARPRQPLAGRHVVLVDDVLDRGGTLAEVRDWAYGEGANTVATAVLVEKDVKEARAITVDYVALQCPDRFLIGCGMDYQGYWRNLPAIYAVPAELEAS